MNDTASHSTQLRRGARRGLALLASAAMVASMTAAASAENGPSDEDIISRSAWGVYNTSRVFEPWAEIPLSFDPGSPMTDVRLGTPPPKCEARAAGYWASYALEEGMIPGVMAPFGYKQNPTLARAANPPYAGSYGDAPVESEVAPAGKDAGPYYHASCPTPLAGQATARHFHVGGQGFSIGAATTDTEQHFEPAQHLVSGLTTTNLTDVDLGSVHVQQIGSYLKTGGDRFAEQWTSERYNALSLSLDLHKIRPEDVTVPTTVIAITGDRLVPIAQSRELARRLGGTSQLIELDSSLGHDAFLGDSFRIAPFISELLQLEEELVS